MMMKTRKPRTLVRLMLVLALFLGLLLPILLTTFSVSAAGALAWTDTQGPGGTSPYQINSLAWDGSRLYAGTASHGVWSYDPKTNKWADTGGTAFGGLRIVSLVWNGSTLYAASDGTGVWRYNPSTSVWVNTGGPLSGYQVSSLAWDGSGLYAGTIGHGVWRYDPATGNWTDTGAWILGETVGSLAWDGSALYASGDYLFLGNMRVYGVYRYDPGPKTWTSIGMNSLVTLSMLWNGSQLYVGSDERGIYRYNSPAGTWTDISGNVGAYNVSSLAWDGSSLYAGTNYEGIWRYDPSSATWRDTNSPLNSDWVNSILWAGSSLYVGTSHAGVWYYDPLNALPFSIASIGPNSGIQTDASLSVTIEGNGFTPNSTVRLENNASLLVVSASDAKVVSSTQITCKFDLTAAALNKYDVVVRNPDNQEARLKNGFTVTNICGQGAAVSLVAFGFMLGLLSLAGSGMSRRRRKQKTES